MAASHDPNKPNRGYFEQPRALRPLPPLPPGYDWKQQIWKYSTRDLVSKIQEEPKPRRWDKLTPSEEELSNGVKTYEYYRTGIDEFGRPRRYKSNFNQLSGVFCHRGYYDQAMKIPENSFLAIDHGLQQHSFHLYELDVKLHTNVDKSLSLRKAFLSHDATGARTTADCGRWSQNDGRDVIGTMLVTRGIDLEKNDFASTFQETDAQLLGLDKLLYSCDNAYSGMTGNGPAPLLDPNRYAGSTFQLDISQPGDAFAKIVAWFRYHRFANLQVIIKGYNRFYPDGPALLEAVNRSTSFKSGSLLDTFRAHDEGAISVAPMHLAANSSGRRRIVTSSRDKTIRIWDYHTSMLEGTLVGHEGAVNLTACWGSVIVSGSDDTTVRIWNANTGDLKHKLRGHKGPINAVAVASLNRELLVASASSDQKVLLWDGESGKLRHTLRGHKSKATSVTFFRRSETLIYVASGSSNGIILIWDARTGKLMHTLNGHSDEVTYLVSFGRNLASGSVDGTA